MHSAESLILPTADPNITPDTAPAWHLIHFDVHCARCSHDLRGKSVPTCPACKLDFSWRQAAPLDQLTCGKCNYHLYGLSDSRCPECGAAVDWNEALLRYRRREKPLFEYRWRDRPIRSFFRTWLLAMRPKRLWQTIDLHDPPQVKPLIAWIVLFLLTTALCIPIGFGVGDWIQNRPLFGVTSRAGFLNAAYDLLASIQRFIFLPGIYVLPSLMLLWVVFSFASLMVFRQSMRLCKVRSAHVFRVCAYSLLTHVPLFMLLLFSAVFSTSFFQRIMPFGLRRAYFSRDLYLWCALFILVVWSLRQGYRHYIKMPHSLGVAFASQVIAILATMAIPPAVILFRGGW